MKFIPNAITSKVGMALLHAQKHSPNLLFGAGVVGVVGTVVLAARATLKASDVLDDAKGTLDQLDSVIEYEAEEDRIKDKALIYVQTGVKLAKLYGPSVALGVGSIAALSGSHNILTKRNAALTAAYASIEKAFRSYRDRVIEDLGEEKDRTYRYGLEKQTVTTVDENGKNKLVQRTVATGTSIYGRFFGPDNVNWNHAPEYNLFFIRCVQNSSNQRLQAKGYLLLNDVYKDLGLEPTSEGCVVGWLANGNGDGYVDFGLFENADALRLHEFMVGQEDQLLLDFNVDGVIYDKI